MMWPVQAAVDEAPLMTEFLLTEYVVSRVTIVAVMVLGPYKDPESKVFFGWPSCPNSEQRRPRFFQGLSQQRLTWYLVMLSWHAISIKEHIAGKMRVPMNWTLEVPVAKSLPFQELTVEPMLEKRKNGIPDLSASKVSFHASSVSCRTLSIPGLP